MDWLAHIDVDEFLHGGDDVKLTLATAPDTIDALIMPPAEEIAQTTTSDMLLFRRTYFDAGVEKSLIDQLYPVFGAYLRAGFISHTAGKTIARTGLNDVRFGVHLLKRDGVEIENSKRIQSLNLLHRHAPDWDSFAAHLEFRLQKGRYRDRGQSKLGLGDIVDLLREEHGSDGPRQLFDEICGYHADVVQKLEQSGMLIRAKLGVVDHV